MTKKIFLLLMLFISINALNAQMKMETRGIAYGDGYAIYFDGRTCYAPESSVTNGGNVNFSTTGVGISANSSKTTKEIKGILIPKGERVNVFKVRDGFYGDKVSVGGKSVPNMKKAKVFSSEAEECILIGYGDMWYYIPRRCLGQ